MTKFAIFSVLFVFSCVVSAQTMDTRNALYGGLPAVQGVDVNSINEVRQPAQYAVWGAYQSLNGINSIPLGKPFTIIYKDGSSEQAVRTCSMGAACIQPVIGSRKNADGSPVDPVVGSGSGGGGGGGTGGGSNVGRDIIGAGSPNAGNVIVKPLITKDP